MGGEAVAWISALWAVPRVDAGPILAERTVAVRPDDTSGSLARRLVEAGLPALDETLERLQAGDLSAREPDLAQGSYERPVARPEVDWNQPYGAIDRLVRAGSPDQPPATLVDGERRYVLAVRRLKARRQEQPGPLKDLDGRMLAATGDAVIEIAWRPFGHTHAVRPLR